MMIYSTIGGTTRKVALRVARRIDDEDVLEAQSAMSLTSHASVKCVILFCPTYGDEEAVDDFENLLLSFDWSTLAGVPFAFCELGIYTGYEDFGHGLTKVVRNILVGHGLHEIVQPLSLDTVPITDWELVDSWADNIGIELSASA